MSELVTDFNEAEYRARFCKETGHKIDCVEETIDKMLSVAANVSKIKGIPEHEATYKVYDFINDVEKFDSALLKLLSVKGCSCGHKKTN